MQIFKDLSNEKYHSYGSEYISSSFVKGVAKHSVAKALQPLEPSQALIFGDAFHSYMEDMRKFYDRFVVFDDTEIIESIKESRPDISVPSMTKDYKKFKSEFESKLSEGQSVISKDDMDTIEAMHASIITNRGLQWIYDKVDFDHVWDEYSFLSSELDIYGLQYRVRPDRLLVSSNGDDYKREAIIDWKTCQDASEKSFRSDFWRYRYDLQCAFYCMVLEVPMSSFYYVAVEKNYPYNCCVYGIDTETQERASKELSEILHRISVWKRKPSEPTGLPNQNEVTLL